MPSEQSPPRVTRREFAGLLGLSFIPTSETMTTETSTPETELPLSDDHTLRLRYAGRFDQLLASDKVLYVGRWPDVHWRDVLADGEQAVIFTATVSPIDDREDVAPPPESFELVGGEPPLRTTTAAEWLGDPSVEPVPQWDSVYWRTDGPLGTGTTGGLAFAIPADRERVTLAFDGRGVLDDGE